MQLTIDQVFRLRSLFTHHGRQLGQMSACLNMISLSLPEQDEATPQFDLPAAQAVLDYAADVLGDLSFRVYKGEGLLADDQPSAVAAVQICCTVREVQLRAAQAALALVIADIEGIVEEFTTRTAWGGPWGGEAPPVAAAA